MAWIDVISPDEADDELRRLYARMTDPEGNVDGILQIHSLSPTALANHFALYRDAMRGRSPLSRVQREMIGVVVSAINDCHYWLRHHGAGLRELTDDAGLVEALATDHRSAELDPGDRRMLDFAVKLTRRPGDMVRDDVDGLRDAGFDDRAVHDIVLVTAYFAFVNRVADGLGVELEEYLADERDLD